MLEILREDIVSKIASRHVAGDGIDEAIPVCQWARSAGYGVAISPWADANDPPSKTYERYREVFDSMIDKNMDWYLSIKLDSIGNDLGLFQDLVCAAQEAGVRLHLDSMGPESAATTFSFLEKVVGFHQNLGCTLPSRWKRSLEDVERVLDLGLSVRIVKGQWKEPGRARVDATRNYLDIVGRLAGKAHRVAVATHDTSLARKALSCLYLANTHSEMEQFFSLPLNAMNLAREFGCHYRIYVAYGHPGVPYNVRQILSRPRIAAWILADFALKPRRPWSSNGGTVPERPVIAQTVHGYQ